MTARSDKPRRDLHADITNRIIAAIESNPGQPQMPWRRSSTPLWMPENALSKNGYNGINVVNLWVAAEARGFTSPFWATYKQWAELGAQVKKGAKSELVIFYKEFDVEPSPDVTDDDGKRRVARAAGTKCAGGSTSPITGRQRSRLRTRYSPAMRRPSYASPKTANANSSI